jgi:hypothetical protein
MKEKNIEVNFNKGTFPLIKLDNDLISDVKKELNQKKIKKFLKK